MPPRGWTLRVDDMLQAIDKIERFTGGLSLQDFASDEKGIDAVIHNLEVIGEAARHIPDDVRVRYRHIPWDEMIGMRNIIVHEYFAIVLPIVWETVRHDLPAVAPLLREMLTSEGAEGTDA